MLRYVLKGCCADPEHLPNRTAEDFRQQLQSELSAVANNLRDFLYTSSMRNIKVLSPQETFRGREDSSLWREDPVQPSEEAYD
jgi:hypothetical protein